MWSSRAPGSVFLGTLRSIDLVDQRRNVEYISDRGGTGEVYILLVGAHRYNRGMSSLSLNSRYERGGDPT